MRVSENGFFPADMIVINSTEGEGALYVETKNLDGESNLKLKSVAPDLVKMFEQEETFSDLSGIKLNIEEPNNRIYKFDGNMEVHTEAACQSIPLSNDNVVLRGMSLRNT